ncbi:MAG TPA: uracil-DNA glycosylase family protein [Flavisolibacter sp.]|jgi:hypothetical protein|nr:uracil-DNA glycosylase family protein [Flavisolibacter sp.]
MSKGILSHPACKEFYEQINSRQLCVRCREERKMFAPNDKKHNSSYSNMIPGFSSRHLNIPIDVLIIAEAHGGGRKEGFREQIGLQAELEGLEHYYLQQDLSKHHQSEMRKLLIQFDELNFSWVFTDLVKCFVWQANKGGLDGRENFKIAIRHCSKYLDEQLSLLKPKVILSLGSRVSSFFEIKYPKHGNVYQRKGFSVLHSTFPSRNTADHWVKNKEWVPIINQIGSLLGLRLS